MIVRAWATETTSWRLASLVAAGALVVSCGEQFSAGPSTGGGGSGASSAGGSGGALLGDGEPCAAAAECSSNYCVDDVCCDQACAGTCVACNRPNEVGNCGALAAGTDPAHECDGAAVCDGSRACAGGVCQWSQTGGAEGIDTLGSLAIDRAGNIYATGSYQGSASFGGETLIAAPTPAAGIYALKLGADGAHRWSIGFGDGLSENHGSALAVAPDDGVFLVGGLRGGVDFGCAPVTSVGNLDVYVTRLDGLGGCVWTRLFGGLDAQEATDVVVTASAAPIVVAGNFRGSLTLGTTTLTSTGAANAFVAALDEAGTVAWARELNSPADAYARAVGADDEGNIWLGGDFATSITIDGSLYAAAGTSDAFLVKLSPSGTVLLTKVISGPGHERLHDLAVEAGRVVVVGEFDTTLNLGGESLSSHGAKDAFVARFAAGGGHEWSASYGGTGDDGVFGVAIDGAHNIVLTGGFSTAIDFGGGVLEAAGGGDLFLAKLSRDATHLWSFAVGDTAFQAGYRVAVDDDQRVVMGGSFQGTVELEASHTTFGLWDVLLAVFEP